jgi:hypothetical protein
MARVNWNKENLQQLHVYGQSGELDKFAKLIKCTENAARIKYGRMFGTKGDDFDIDKVHPKTHDDAFKSKVNNTISVNPFKIEQVPFTGTRSTPEIVLMLVKQMLSINANKLDSILVPNSVADSKSAANNIFQQAKNYIAKTNQAELVYTIKSTFSGDAKKTYLSGRIWRIK